MNDFALYQLLTAIQHGVHTCNKKLDILLSASNFSPTLQAEINKLDAETTALNAAVEAARPKTSPPSTT